MAVTFLTNEDREELEQMIAEMGENIPESGHDVELDITLTQSGAAADAKAVGDAFGFTTVMGNNLLDISKVTPNKNLNNATGAVIDSTNNALTDYISIESGATVSLWTRYGSHVHIPVTFNKICAYDAEGSFISGANMVGNFTMPEGTAKFRAGISNSYAAESSLSMIVRGVPESVEYEPYRENKISSIKVYSENVTGFAPLVDAVQKSEYNFRKVDSVCDNYSSNVEKIPNIWNGTGTTVSTVYDLYDALVSAHPDYVTKTQIGTTEGDEALPIYRYDFTPKIPQNSQTKLCKMMYCSGTHGGETTSIMVGARFFKDLCENWRTQDLLRTLRFNCYFIVIPLVNPYGFVHNTKQNENSVNLNRNFTNGWVFVEDERDYSGSVPASEIITRTIEQIVSDEKPDFGLDHHIYDNFTNSGKAGYFVGCAKRSADVSCADMLGVWANSKVMRDNTLINDFSKNHFQLLNRQVDFNGYLYGAFPNGFCFETMTGWGNDEMEAVYDSQKFNAEIIGGIFYTAFAGYHTY